MEGNWNVPWRASKREFGGIEQADELADTFQTIHFAAF